MPLVSMKDMMIKGKREGYAIGQFNLNNLDFTQAILQAAEEEKSPVICGVSEGAARYMGGFTTVVHMVKGLMHDYGITVPVAIHLDHGSSFEKCKEAIFLPGNGISLTKKSQRSRRTRRRDRFHRLL